MGIDTEPRYWEEKIHNADYNVLPQYELTPNQLDRVTRFMHFHRPPSPKDTISAIIVPSTSPFIDKQSYSMRVEASLYYAELFPTVPIIYSGKRPDDTRATVEELAAEYCEAERMVEDAVSRGLNPQRTLIERDAIHTGQNVINSINLIGGLLSNTSGLLFICSSYAGRRIDLYAKKELAARGLGDIERYIYDADVDEDSINLTYSDEQVTRKHSLLMREALRLSRYRRQGYL